MIAQLSPKASGPLIVGVCGGKTHGKGVIALALIQRYEFVEVNFADALKRVCAGAFGLPLEYMTTPELKELPLTAYGYPNETPRKIMQYVGTDLFRERWPDIWLDTWSVVLQQHERVVVSDMRFPNEFARVVSRGGYTIRVTHPGRNNTDTHASESHYAGFNVACELLNNGSKEELGRAACAAVGQHFHLDHP